MSFLYNIFIALLKFVMKVGSLFNAKMKKGVVGRKESLSKIKAKIQPNDRVIWMHAASLGEYEQGLPVLEKLKSKFPQHKFIVSFFSPSGYENVAKKKHIADVLFYLPFDEKSEIQHFISHFKTDLFFTVKYDYWYHLLSELKKNGSKNYVISALFYEKQVFFKGYGKWFVYQLKLNVDWFFHQTQHSCDLAKKIGLEKSSVSGDTRFDRVKTIRNRDNHVEFIKGFINEKQCVVFGSSWEAEEKIANIIAEKSPDSKIIIAPHDLKRVLHLQKMFPNAILYSQLNLKNLVFNNQVLIIDSIGLLSKLYAYADIAIVGGGFHSAGLHNILEAATFGKPVFFGNQYKKNPEADALISFGGAKSFGSEEELASETISLLKTPSKVKEMGQKAAAFIEMQPDSSEIILKALDF